MQKQIVIGHFLYSFGKGGMENVVARLINYSDRDKFRHVVISLTEDTALKERINRSLLKLYVLKKGSVLRNSLNLYKIIKKEKIDILHSRGWPTMLESVIVKSLCLRLSIIFAFHGRAFNELKGINFKRHFMQLILARFFNQIVTLTQSMREEIVDEFKLPENKIKIVRNGIPIVSLNADNRRKIRSEFNIGEGEIVVGYVGRLDPVKGIDIIIEAFDEYYKKQSKGYLFIAGEGEILSDLKAKTGCLKSSERIIFTGFRNDIMDLMQAFDIYVQASLYEGLSNTILEAMSMGLPVICTSVGGNKDIIEHGMNGYLIDRGDVKSLTKYIFRLLGNPEERDNIGRSNIEKAGRLYSLKKMIEEYESLYTCLKYPC